MGISDRICFAVLRVVGVPPTVVVVAYGWLVLRYRVFGVIIEVFSGVSV